MSFQGKWLADSAAFRRECLRIAKDLTGFKKNPVYCRYINNDNRPRETAEAFYWHIRQHYPLFGTTEMLDLFRKNDKIGNPTLHNINGTVISPGTLRFIKVLGDVITAFGTPSSIVEIGAGYGGQCLIFKLASMVDYTIIDIPESLEVSRAYLGMLDVQANFISKITEPVGADVVISDYCISEMDKEGIDYYIETVVRHCRNGYFTCNLIGEIGHLLDRLREVFTYVKDAPEEPKTSRHNNIILYAMDNRYL
jgi:hypothetical protein